MKKRIAVMMLTVGISMAIAVPAFAYGNNNNVGTTGVDGHYNNNGVRTNAVNNTNNGMDWGWLGLLGLIGLAGLRNRNREPDKR